MEKQRTRFGSGVVVAVFAVWWGLGVAAGVPARAQVPLGGEFQVNSYTPGGQYTSSVAMGSDGKFVAVWESTGSAGTDTSGSSIQGQRYASDGSPQGAEVQVNTYTTANQLDPAVVVDPDGDFTVVWESFGSSGTDTSERSIQGQRYASNGSAVGGQFQVNTNTIFFQSNPSIALADDGSFVVVWDSDYSPGTDTSNTSIQGQRYASNGSVVGSEFQVNSYTVSFQDYPSVSMASGGAFVVVWASLYSSGTDNSFGIQGQRFASAGSMQGAQFQVNTYTTGYQYRPSAAMNSDGDFVVAWESQGSSGTDTDSWSIQRQRFASNGSPQGGEFQVNTYTTSGQRTPSVAADSSGDFVVAWQSDGSFGTDTASDSIQGQRYASDGSPRGAQFQVNSYTTLTQSGASVAFADVGGFVVTWESYGSFGTDADLYSVQAQRFSTPPSVPSLAPRSAAAVALLLLLAASFKLSRRA